MNFDPNQYALVVSDKRHKGKTVLVRSYDETTQIYYAQVNKKPVGFTKTQLEFLPVGKLPF